MLVFYLVLVLVRLVQPCSMNVGILFGLVRSHVRLQPCSCMLVRYSTHVSMAAMFYVCWYRKIPKISPSKYKPPKLVTQKTLR